MAKSASSEHGEGSFGSPHTFRPQVPWPDASSCTGIRRAARTGRRCGCGSTASGSSTPTRPGSRRDLRGLTLLEAAAVGGETLPVDALANALGAGRPRRSGTRTRVAVAMSGGVDSAVDAAQGRGRGGRRHAAAVARSARPGLGAGVLLAVGRDRGPRGVPRARAAARDARPARGVPPRGRDPLRPRLCPRRDPEPVHRAATAASASRSCSRSRAGSAPRGSPPATTRESWSATARSLLARATRPGEGPELHARPARSTLPRPHLVPARRADEGTDPSRGRRSGPRGRRARREPGGVLPRGRRLPRVPRPAGAARCARRDRRRAGREARDPRRLLALHARPAPRARRRRRRAALRAPHRAAHEHGRRRAA